MTDNLSDIPDDPDALIEAITAAGFTEVQPGDYSWIEVAEESDPIRMVRTGPAD